MPYLVPPPVSSPPPVAVCQAEICLPQMAGGAADLAVESTDVKHALQGLSRPAPAESFAVTFSETPAPPKSGLGSRQVRSQMAQVLPAAATTPLPPGPGSLTVPAVVQPGLPADVAPAVTSPAVIPATALPAKPLPTTTLPAASSPSLAATPAGSVGVMELMADRQEYDELRRVFTAEGTVTMRFRESLLDADRLQVNLLNRFAVAEGNVALTRGEQVLRGQRLEYNFVQGDGTVQKARGEIFLPTAGRDLSFPTGPDSTVLTRPPSDRITANQPTQTAGSTGGIFLSVGSGRDAALAPGQNAQGGQVRRFRFEADKLDFTPEGWQAENIEITNDPFSPPELVLKAERARLTRVSPLRDEIVATRPRLVFDQRVSIPVISRVVLDRQQREPPLVSFGFDGDERGGLFMQRTFELISSDRVRLSFTPQYFLQRAIFDSQNPLDLGNFGFRSKLTANIAERTRVIGKLSMTSLDLNEIDDNLRASVRAQQLVGTHSLGLEYSYRDRLFNGSLGFQTVQSSLGAVLTSPQIVLGKTGIVLNYQAAFQNITSSTDRADLLATNRTNNRINLSRLQASGALGRGFTLWQGKPLPPTPTEGLRYTPQPVQPYLALGTRLEGVLSSYSNGDTQNNLIATVGLYGQFGNFSRPTLDYTAFNVTYSQVIGAGQSPFLFDRTADTRTLGFGITQQIYGPLRLGFQSSYNLDTQDAISTDYIVEYSRRAYGITLRYNPVLSIGSIGLRISDFNWDGGTEPFAGSGITSVEGGVIRRTE